MLKNLLLLSLAGATLLATIGNAAAAPEPKPEPKADDLSTWVWNYPEGTNNPLLRHETLTSRSMGKEVGYNVYLPPGYAESKGRFPVVYFLHGATGNENSDAGAFSGILDGAIRAGTLPPVIGVFPNGGPFSGYVDRADNSVMAETLIVKELVPTIDRKYRTLAKREGRLLAGFSMGGGGSVRLALKHPKVFAAAASWGGSIRGRARQGAALVGGAEANDPYVLAEKNADAVRDRARILLIVGEKDSLEAHNAYVARLRELKIPNEFHVLPMIGHQLDKYYELSADHLLKFLGDQLRADKVAPEPVAVN
jgi:endo-1,4-beta-xylanase